jgi:branched-chain amino acid transport system substrate-binding protein
MHRRTVIIALGATLHVATGFSAAAQPLRIGVSLGLTGQYNATSMMQRRAYEMWRDETNAKGGILGRPIDLSIVNDGSDAGRAIAIYTDFIGRQSMDFVFAPYSSELTGSVAPIVEAAGCPTLAPGASADEIWQKGYRNIFGLLTTASRYSQGMMRLAHDAGLSSIAVIAATDRFSAGAAEGTVKWAPYLQLKVVHDARLAAGGSDAETALRAARQAGADLVVVAGHLDDAVAARLALKAIAWEPRAFYATIGPALPEYLAKVGDLNDGTFSTSLWEPLKSSDFPGANEFASRFRARFGVDPSYQAATAYAAGQILEAAITVAGSTNRDRVRDALGALDTYSILGRFAVDHTGMQVKRFEMIIQWQKGHKEIVWPEAVRTAAPVFGA